jgi:DNA-binding transcriptional LysR family regulator
MGGQDFIALESTRSFHIACLPFIASLLSSNIAEIHAQAPNVQIRIQHLSDELTDDLGAGRTDCAVGSFGRIPDWLDTRPLCEEPMVFVMRANGPLAGKELTLTDLANIPHIDIQTDEASAHLIANYYVKDGLERQVAADGHDALRAVLDEHSLERKTILTVSDTPSALFAVERSDAISLVVRRAAVRLRDFCNLEMFEPPYAAPPLKLQLLWHKHQTSDPGAIWLREMIELVILGRQHATHR